MPRAKKATTKTGRFELIARVRGKHAEIVKVPLERPAEGKVVSRLPGRVPAKKTRLDDPKLGRRLEAAFRNAVKLSLHKR
ncbi:MAG: hypothetical protein JST54_33835 [Deltaproteobacteria bacterium]|nr:hypothetical protein [Deltaproteobacteria bacterium]